MKIEGKRSRVRRQKKWERYIKRLTSSSLSQPTTKARDWGAAVCQSAKPKRYCWKRIRVLKIHCSDCHCKFHCIFFQWKVYFRLLSSPVVFFKHDLFKELALDSLMFNVVAWTHLWIEAVDVNWFCWDLTGAHRECPLHFCLPREAWIQAIAFCANT